MKKINIKEFRELGYLQELNRRFLHPLGLALEITIDNEKEELSGIWDCRDNPEGIYYDIKNSDNERVKKFIKNKNFIDHELNYRLIKRKEILGFDYENIPELLKTNFDDVFKH